nr:hypothetical protein [Tanacetum cinerariifolium]
MRTRSSSNRIVESFMISRRRNKRSQQQVTLTIVEISVATIADNRTMDEMLQAPTEGYGDAIVATHLKNEITRFTQKFKETFGEAWERFNEMLRQCPHNIFLELNQIDTFYNGLNKHEQDSLNAAAGGNLLMSTTSSGSSSSTDARIDKLTDTISNFVETFNKKMTTLAMVKAVEETCVIYGGAHPYYDCIATDSNTSSACAAMAQTNHASNFQAHNNQVQNGFSNEFANYMKTNEVNMRTIQNQMNNIKTELKNEFQYTLRSQNKKIDQNQNEIKNMFACLMNNPSGSGSLSSNIVANPRGEIKAITTRSGIAYEGPSIPPISYSLSKEVEQETKATKGKVQFTSSKSTFNTPKIKQRSGIPLWGATS